MEVVLNFFGVFQTQSTWSCSLKLLKEILMFFRSELRRGRCLFAHFRETCFDLFPRDLRFVIGNGCLFEPLYSIIFPLPCSLQQCCKQIIRMHNRLGEVASSAVPPVSQLKCSHFRKIVILIISRVCNSEAIDIAHRLPSSLSV